MQVNSLSKYIVALIVGLAFAYSLTWLTGVSANLMPAIGPYKWARENIEVAMFLANIYAYVLPLGLISLLIGYFLRNFLKTRSTVVVVLAAFPSLLLLLYPYIYRQLSDFNMLHWFMEIPKVLVILCGIAYMVKRVEKDL